MQFPEPLEDPERHIPVGQERQRADVADHGRVGRPERHHPRQPDDRLGVGPLLVGRDADVVREQVVHGVEAGPGRVAPGRHLDRRRLPSEHGQAVAGRVSRQIDQDVDPVRPDPRLQLVIRVGHALSPVRHPAPDRLGQPVRLRCDRVDGHLDDRRVMLQEDRPEPERRRVLPHVPRDVPDAQDAVGVAVVRVGARRARHQAVVPSADLGGPVEGDGRVTVQGEDLIAEDAGSSGAAASGPLERRQRAVDVAEALLERTQARPGRRVLRLGLQDAPEQRFGIEQAGLVDELDGGHQEQSGPMEAQPHPWRRLARTAMLAQRPRGATWTIPPGSTTPLPVATLSHSSTLLPSAAGWPRWWRA
jgi:hypothetical protein